MTEFVTSAPVAYDGFGTRTVEWLPYQEKSGAQYRVVAIAPDALDWQTGRYASGLYPRIPRAEWPAWVAARLVQDRPTTTETGETR